MFVQKYIPQKLEDFIGNEKQIRFAKNWIEDFKKAKRKTKPILLITGNISYGKSTLAKTLLEKYKYEPTYMSSADKRNPKMIADVIDKVMTNCSIYEMLSEYSTGLIIDELESICEGANQTEKGSMSEIIDIIKAHSKTPEYYTKPLVLISLKSTDKKIKKILKFVEHIQITKPSTYSFEKLLKRIITAEKIPIDQASLSIFLSFTDDDYRQLLINFENMLNALTPPYTFNNVKNYIETVFKKDKVPNTYDIVNKLLTTDMSPHESQALYQLDKKNTFYIMHQNYPEAVFKGTASTKTKLKTLIDISTDMMNCDIVNEYIFSNCDWNINNYVGHLTATKPNYSIGQMKRKQNYIPTLTSSTLLGKKSQYGSNKKSVGTTLYYLNTEECSLNCRYELDLLQTRNLAEIVIYHLFNAKGDMTKLLKFMDRFKLCLKLDKKKEIKVKPLEALLKLVSFEGNSIPIQTKYKLRDVYLTTLPDT